MNEKLLYETIKSLLRGEEADLTGHDFGDWADTVTELAQSPPDRRMPVFESLDTFHRGALHRLLSTYREVEPEVVSEPDEEIIDVDGCAPLPAYVQPDPALVAEASPWLNCYVDYSRYWSPRSYEGYHEVCGLWLLSTIAARRVAFELSGLNYTNLYMLLAGISTLTAKTRAANIAIEMLIQAGFDWLLAPSQATPQALISYLVGEVPQNFDKLSPTLQERAKNEFGFAAQRGWFYEEFGDGITAMTQSSGYMAEFRSLLRKFDDCPLFHEYRTHARGKERVERPYLTMLGNLTPSDLRDVAKRGAKVWGDGFLARFAFATPSLDDISDARFPLGTRVAPDELVKPLQAWHQRLGLPLVNTVQEDDGSFLPGPIKLTLSASPKVTLYPVDEVIDPFYDYNSVLIAMGREVTDDFRPYYGRLHEKALRVAVLLASIEGDTAVRLKHWAKGQQIAERWRASLHRCYNQINERSVTEEAALEKRILEALPKVKDPTASNIATYIRGYSTPQIKHLLDRLVESGVLVISLTKSKKTPRYRLPNDET